MKMWKTLVSLALVLMMTLSMGTALAVTTNEVGGEYISKINVYYEDDREQFVEWTYPAEINYVIYPDGSAWGVKTLEGTTPTVEITDFAIKSGYSLNVGFINNSLNNFVPIDTSVGNLMLVISIDGNLIINETNYASFGGNAVPSSKAISVSLQDFTPPTLSKLIGGAEKPTYLGYGTLAFSAYFVKDL